jgi:hypothetical protein
MLIKIKIIKCVNEFDAFKALLAQGIDIDIGQ